MVRELVLKTGVEWNKLASEEIVTDPDGWQNKGISFKETPITMEEYFRLKFFSTVEFLQKPSTQKK